MVNKVTLKSSKGKIEILTHRGRPIVVPIS